jgi:hypothetical protein
MVTFYWLKSYNLLFGLKCFKFFLFYWNFSNDNFESYKLCLLSYFLNLNKILNYLVNLYLYSKTALKLIFLVIC